MPALSSLSAIAPAKKLHSELSSGGQIGGRALRRRRGNGGGDDAAAQHTSLAFGGIIEDASLAGRHAILARDQFDLDGAMGVEAQPRRPRRPRRANLHKDFGTPFHRLADGAVAEPIDIAEPDAARAQRFARTDHDPARGGVEPHDIERRAGREAETAALADGEMDDAVMMAQHPAVEVDDFARRRGARAQSLDDVRIMPARHEADVLAVLLVGDRKAEPARQFAGIRFAAIAERETQQIELPARGGEQEIALIALGFAGAIKRAAAAGQSARGDVMAGGQHGGAKIAGGLQEIAELDRLVALHARHRRFARDVALGKAVDHRFFEAVLVIEDIMRNADTFGYGARVMNVAAGAAGALAVGGRAMVIELQRDADDA